MVKRNGSSLRVDTGGHPKKGAASPRFYQDQHEHEHEKASNAGWPGVCFRQQRQDGVLAEKMGQFVPSDTTENKAEMLSWLIFVAPGIRPYCGQAAHFKHFWPDTIEYAVNRYNFEAWRHWLVISDRLATQPYMMGQDHTIADMSVWGSAKFIPFVLRAHAWEKLPHVKRLLDEINNRPVAQRTEALKTKLTFKTKVDADVQKMHFPFNERQNHSVSKNS